MDSDLGLHAGICEEITFIREAETGRLGFLFYLSIPYFSYVGIL